MITSPGLWGGLAARSRAQANPQSQGRTNPYEDQNLILNVERVTLKEKNTTLHFVFFF